MEFCPKCGAPLVKRTKNLGCPRCNYTAGHGGSLKSSEKLNERKEVAVISKNIEVNPIVEETCPKCEHKKAYFWMQQTRSSDESPTKFFKCVKCEHTWRDYK
jgi:DNA-directed RNA polymerase subunit M